MGALFSTVSDPGGAQAGAEEASAEGLGFSLLGQVSAQGLGVRERGARGDGRADCVCAEWCICSNASAGRGIRMRRGRLMSCFQVQGGAHYCWASCDVWLVALWIPFLDCDLAGRYGQHACNMQICCPWYWGVRLSAECASVFIHSF